MADLYQKLVMLLGDDLTVLILGIVLTLGFIQFNSLFLIWLERKVAGHMQLRLGPMEVGPHGIIQTIADGIKLVGKQLITPRYVDKWLFMLAPVIVLMPVPLAFLVLPVHPGVVVLDMNVGILLIFGFSTLNVLTILMAGWGSHNKYSLLGAIRAVAQNIAYESPLLVTVITAVLWARSLNMSAIVDAQDKIWFVFTPWGALAFLIFLISATAETNRAPFDLPEAESELVAGFHTEYSGMRFAMFFLAEYTNMFIVSAVGVTLFLGGWRGPILPGFIWFLLKSYVLVFMFLWFRWTFPRVRFDQLLGFAWKVLLPIALVNLVVTGGAIKLIDLIR